MFRKLTLTLCALMMMCTSVAAETLVVATNCTYPPMEFLNDKKVPNGYSIAYATELLKRAGYEMELRDVAWDGIFAGLAAGNYDLLALPPPSLPNARRPSTSPNLTTAWCRPWSCPRARRSTAWPTSRA